MSPPLSDHRAFLNRYYGTARYIYDLTRKYYLFGRDRAIERLLSEPWDTLVEVGPGTGRNLVLLHRARPHARVGGVEAADAMLRHAARRCPWASLMQGFAEDAEYLDVLGEPPQRILFSYCLSMVQGRDAALARALASVAPGGQVLVVDFGDFGGLPGPVRDGLRSWLAAFRVRPLDPEWLEDRGAALTFGPGRYYVLAAFTRGVG